MMDRRTLPEDSDLPQDDDKIKTEGVPRSNDTCASQERGAAVDLRGI